jgi:hypothetical protein
MKSTSKPRTPGKLGGRVPILLRLDSRIADRYAIVAGRVERSRNQVIEKVLEAVIDLLVSSEAEFIRDPRLKNMPDFVFTASAEHVLGQLVDLGIANEVLREGLRLHRESQKGRQQR